MSDIAIPRFERITPYDMPMTLLEQLFDGEWSARTVRNTLFDTMKLSPQERDGLRARLKASAGNNRVAGAIIDTALNPWVWLTFVTSPAGSRAIAEGRQLLGPGKAYLDSIKEGGGFLSQIGALTGAQVLKWGQATDALRGVGVHLEQKITELGGFERSLTEWMHANGITHLDPDRLTPDKADLLEKASNLLHASLVGADRDITQKTVSKIVDGVPQVKETRIPAWLNSEKVNLEEQLAGMGLTGVRDEARGFLKQRLLDLFAEDGATRLVPETVDADKVLRQWRGLRNSVVSGSGASNGASPIREVLEMGMGLNAADLDELLGNGVKAGKMTEEGFTKLVKDVFATGVNEQFYLPRNVYSAPTEPLSRRIRNAAAALGSSPSSVMRSQGMPVYHPEALEGFYRTFTNGVTQDFIALKEAQKKVLNATINADGEWVAGSMDKPMRTAEIDPIESIRRYNNDTARTYAMHVVDAAKDGELAVGQRMEWGDYRSPHTFEGGPSTTMPFADAEAAGTRPLGGFSYADSLASAYVNMEDQHAKDMLGRVIVPAVMGSRGIKHTASAAALYHARATMGMIADSWLGRTIKNVGGEWGARLIDGMSDASKLDPNVLLSDSGRMQRGMAKLLYTTHLGWNVGSAMVNLTQPMGLAATWLGAGNVMKGYGEGFGALFGYLGERWKQYGVAAISELQREELIRKVVPNAHLYGLAAPQLAQIDRVAFEQGSRFGGETAWQKYMGYALGLFSNTEIVNRVTVGAAVSNAYKAGGRAVEVGGPAWRRDVANAVRETQFGSGPLTTPIAMMSDEVHPWGRALANPLTRMFMSYPLRTTTGALYTSKFVGGNRGVWGAVRDFGRAMGISAVMYEAGKNLAGVNLERAGYFAGVTDIVPGFKGGRFDSRDAALPAPPIVDIPLSIVKALAEEDRDLLGQTMWRMFPFGGVAAGRAIRALPDIGRTPVANLQAQYVNWNDRDEEGRVALYKADGTFLGRRHPTAIILQAFGADLGAYQDESEFVRYVSQQQDEIRKYQKAAIDAMLEGRQKDAQAVQDEAQRRFGFPLVITQAQLKANMSVRETPRADRVLGGLPQRSRGMYQQIEQQTLPGVAGAKASPFDQETIRQAMEAAASQQQPPSGFAPVTGF